MPPKEKPHNLKDVVLERIKEDVVVPKSRLFYAFREGIFWSLFGMSLLIGAAAVAAMIFVETHAGWEYYELTHDNLLTFVVSTLPFVWIGLLTLMLVVGLINIRFTRRGYRYRLTFILLCATAGSVLFGTLLHFLGGGYVVDDMFGRHLPLHKPVLTQQMGAWQNPQEGRLFGTVHIPSHGEYLVTDRDGSRWELIVEELHPSERARLTEGAFVRIAGVLATTSGMFYACVVLPDIKPIHTSPNDVMKYRKKFREDMNVRYGQKNGERNIEQVRTSVCEGVRSHRLLLSKPNYRSQ